MKLKFAAPAAIAAICVAFAAASPAATYTETGDAGETPATAQICVGPALTSLTAINGALTSTNQLSDGDMFEIYINSRATFSASNTAFVAGSNNFDSQLFLFSASGLGLAANDDSPSGGEQSSIPAGSFTGAAGLYYILIGGASRYPVSNSGVIFPNVNDAAGDDPTSVYGPTGPGGALPITGYTGNSNESGSYAIALTGAQFVPVPEPGTTAAVLAGVAGIAFASRFRRRTAR